MPSRVDSLLDKEVSILTQIVLITTLLSVILSFS